MSFQKAEEYRRYLNARTKVPYHNSLDGPAICAQPGAVPISELRAALAELESFEITVS